MKSDINGSGPYELEVFEAYGDDDLLCNSANAGTCDGSAPMTLADYTNDNVICKGSAGDQFCATARLNTTAGRRLDN